MILETLAGVIGGNTVVGGVLAEHRTRMREMERRVINYQHQEIHTEAAQRLHNARKFYSGDQWTPSEINKMKPKKCTHEHAIRGTCMTCGEERV